jgi:multisubunit Na+/H+ antiporter MnhE subunit
LYAINRAIKYGALNATFSYVELVIAFGLAAISQALLLYIVSNDLFGISLRIAIPYVVLLSGNIYGFSANCGGISEI